MGDNHNLQKKIALFNDFTGFGRCALTVQIPIISKLKVQAVPVPTSIFSNHTAFESFYMTDYTDHLMSYLSEWKKLNLRFEAILCGYLASEKQFDVINSFTDNFLKEDGIFILDPIMGDNGKIYKAYQGELTARMKMLASKADIITPNVTEACILTDTDYKTLSALSDKEKLDKLLDMAVKLTVNMNASGKVVISGVSVGNKIGNIICEKGNAPTCHLSNKVGSERCGTGDIFSSVIAADVVMGNSLENSTNKAAAFIRKCILASDKMGIPLTDGVCFEEVIDKLK